VAQLALTRPILAGQGRQEARKAKSPAEPEVGAHFSDIWPGPRTANSKMAAGARWSGAVARLAALLALVGPLERTELHLDVVGGRERK
jgi:hypothetical protein